eukprot:4499644-Amphidinium_carterae.2
MGRGSARERLWRRIRAVHPDPMGVMKAHRSHEEVAGDAWAELLWRGYGLADRLAKQGALGHPGGAEQMQRVMLAEEALSDTLGFKARQLE